MLCARELTFFFINNFFHKQSSSCNPKKIWEKEEEEEAQIHFLSCWLIKLTQFRVHKISHKIEKWRSKISLHQDKGLEQRPIDFMQMKCNFLFRWKTSESSANEWSLSANEKLLIKMTTQLKLNARNNSMRCNAMKMIRVWFGWKFPSREVFEVFSIVWKFCLRFHPLQESIQRWLWR